MGKKIGIGCGAVLLLLILLGVIGAIVGEPEKGQKPAETNAASGSSEAPAEPEAGVTMANYQRVKTGMTHEQVSEILGSAGEEMSSNEMAGIKTVMVQWEGNSFASNMNATFQDGKLVQKAQFGLK